MVQMLSLRLSYPVREGGKKADIFIFVYKPSRQCAAELQPGQVYTIGPLGHLRADQHQDR